MSHSWRSRAGVIAVAVTGAFGAFAGQAAAQDHVRARRHAAHVLLAQGPTTTCTLKSGQTPNVDKLMPTINWTTAADFGGRGQLPVAPSWRNLNIATAGEHTFRLTSDDGSVLRIDGNVVDRPRRPARRHVQGRRRHAHRGLPRAAHRLLRGRRRPGPQARVAAPRAPAASWSSRARVLSTEAGVVRVTAPGSKYCEGADRHGRRRPAPGHGQPELHADQPAPAGLPAEGLRHGLPAGRPHGPDHHGRRQPPAAGSRTRSRARSTSSTTSPARRAQGPGDLHQGRRRAAEPDGHPGHRRQWYVSERDGPHRAAADTTATA